MCIVTEDGFVYVCIITEGGFVCVCIVTEGGFVCVCIVTEGGFVCVHCDKISTCSYTCMMECHSLIHSHISPRHISVLVSV